MATLEFVPNKYIDKFLHEWPVGTLLRQMKEHQDGTIQTLNKGITVIGYRLHCIGGICKGCHSNGKILIGRTRSSHSTEFCMGLSFDKFQTYWEEDR